MKRLLLALGLLAGCHDDPSGAIVVANPFAGSGLVANQLCATLTVFSGTVAAYTFGPVAEAPAAGGFAIGFDGISPGNYRFVILVADYVDSDCESGGNGAALLEFHDDNVTLSAGDANIFDGSSRGAVGARWELPTVADADSDNDGLPNLDEVLAELDPYSPWTRIDIDSGARGDILELDGGDARWMLFVTAGAVYRLADQEVVPLTNTTLADLTATSRRGQNAWVAGCEPSCPAFTSVRAVRDRTTPGVFHVSAGSMGGGNVLSDDGAVYYGTLTPGSLPSAFEVFNISPTGGWDDRIHAVWDSTIMYKRDTTYDFFAVRRVPPCVATSTCDGTAPTTPEAYMGVGSTPGTIFTHDPSVVSLDVPDGERLHTTHLYRCGVNAVAMVAGSTGGSPDAAVRIAQQCNGGTYAISGTYASVPGADLVRTTTSFRDGDAVDGTCYLVSATLHSGNQELVRQSLPQDPTTRCVIQTPVTDQIVLLPSGIGTITALHVGRISLADGSTFEPLFIGDDTGKLWMSEGIMFYFPSFDSWTALPALPDADPGPILSIRADARPDSGIFGAPAGLVRSVYVATPRGVYRMP
jgi:hypothetical protein